MARKYDRLIRYYQSWFDDLADPDKELSGAECWQVMLAIRDCQVLNSTEPLRNLPLSIRRALSMSTLIEQVARIIEKCESMRERGRSGGQATQIKTLAMSSMELKDEDPLTPPEDGIERNYSGLQERLLQYHFSQAEINRIAKASNFGQIGNPVWRFIYKAGMSGSPREYLLKCLSNFIPGEGSQAAGKEVQS